MTQEGAVSSFKELRSEQHPSLQPIKGKMVFSAHNSHIFKNDMHICGQTHAFSTATDKH